MKHISIKELLQWRQAQAEADAPPAPRSQQLLAMSTDWWETRPEEFQKMATRLGKMALTKGQITTVKHGNVETSPVPTLLMLGGEATEASVELQSFGIHNGWLRLRFQLPGTDVATSDDLEATFVSDEMIPLFATPIISNGDNEYQIEAELTENSAEAWAGLKINDRMPFRFIIRAEN